MSSGFTVKDSGNRIVLSSGMQRDTTEGKTDYSLVLDGPMFDRWAIHLTKGAVKYEKRNWMKATHGDGSFERFKESALRHFLQWYRGDVDEDHAAAVYFNINGAEYVKSQKPSKAPAEYGIGEDGPAVTSTGHLFGCDCYACEGYKPPVASSTA